MKKTIKRILLSSIFESLGLTALSGAWAWHKGTFYVWWYYPIMILLLFVWIVLCKTGFEIYIKE